MTFKDKQDIESRLTAEAMVLGYRVRSPPARG